MVVGLIPSGRRQRKTVVSTSFYIHRKEDPGVASFWPPLFFRLSSPTKLPPFSTSVGDVCVALVSWHCRSGDLPECEPWCQLKRQKDAASMQTAPVKVLLDVVSSDALRSLIFCICVFALLYWQKIVVLLEHLHVLAC